MPCAAAASLPARSHSASSSRRESPVSSFQHAVESFVSSVPVLSRLTSRETYYCQICLGNCPASDGFQLSSCGHIFCSHCLQSYVEKRLPEAALFGLLCPFLPSVDHPSRGLDSGCAIEIKDSEVQTLCGEATLQQLQRFRTMRQDETYRECPSCQAQVLGGSSRSPVLTCGECSLVFCFVHANAHPGQSCWQFDMAQRLSQLRANVHLAHVSRNCPGCSMKIIKDGGCNHMTCAYCGEHFCWLCGRHLTGAGAVQRHFASWNVCGCPGLQMQESLGRCPTYCLTPFMCCLRIFIPLLNLLMLVILGFAWICWPFLWLVYLMLLSPWSLVYCLLRCCGFDPPCHPGRALMEFWNLVCQQQCESDCCDSD